MLQRTSGWSTKNTGVHEHVNPNKCAFGISAGQLLGFLIHERRIEVGQKSISAIDKIEAPSNKKELQSLMDMINFRVNWNRAIITLMFLKFAITIQLTTPVPL
jgi:hypothetical protein